MPRLTLRCLGLTFLDIELAEGESGAAQFIELQASPGIGFVQAELDPER